ncbi:uncharacterized protein LOC106058266 [Biomphalaria glabrata]|uniref:Uncharacterized protein LOC106058266 n=1 Tax=Biomphalaria glabrata TaxID=6526 RepID=A0A9W3AZ74_BIOGL|nr:uncharacterized protein LOC106058266 [Biomphalaria glabrata]
MKDFDWISEKERMEMAVAEKRKKELEELEAKLSLDELPKIEAEKERKEMALAEKKRLALEAIRLEEERLMARYKDVFEKIKANQMGDFHWISLKMRSEMALLEEKRQEIETGKKKETERKKKRKMRKRDVEYGLFELDRRLLEGTGVEHPAVPK